MICIVVRLSMLIRSLWTFKKVGQIPHFKTQLKSLPNPMWGPVIPQDAKF